MRNTFKKLISDFIFPCIVLTITLFIIPGIADGQVNWPGRQLEEKSSIHGQSTKKHSRIRFEERGEVIVVIDSRGKIVGTYPATHNRVGEKWQNTTTSALFFTLQDAVNAANDGETIQQISNSFNEGLTTIDKKLTIDGAGKFLTSTSSTWGIYVNSEDVVIQDLNLYNAGTYGIITSCDADNLQISNTLVGDCGGSGFAINSCDNAVLTDISSVSNGGLGLSITDCNNMTINGLTTSGNAFSGGFSAGVGFFSGGACAPPAGISNITFSGTIGIGEPVKAYQQILSGGGTITGISYPPSLTYYAGGGGTPPNITAKYYVTSRAEAYTLAATLLAPPTSAPLGTVFVGEEATNDYYVDDLLSPAPPATGSYTLSIQAAIDYLQAGKSIHIENGTYAEASTIDKSLTIDGAGAVCGDVVIDGGGTLHYGFKLNNNVQDVTIRDVKIQNTVGNTSEGGIFGSYNDGLTIDNVCLENTSGRGAIFFNGGIDDVDITNCEISGSGVNNRAIVIWNGDKTNINISNNHVHDIGGCCGIELQDGNASAVTMNNNIVERTGDSGMAAVGLNGSVGSNTISNNTVEDCGRFGIEIKNPNGSTTVSGNNVSLTASFSTLKPTEERDIAGIAVFRRGVISGNVDIPTGTVITGNTVTGYIQDNASSTSEGFGIVVEGTSHNVNGNTLSNNDVGIQVQAGHTPAPPADGDQSDLADQYFGRGNTQNTCANTIGTNTFSGNGTDTREVGVSAGYATNLTTGKTFCSIQAAIDDPTTVNGDVIAIAAGTYAENILVNKSLEIYGAGVGNTIIVPSFVGPNPPSCPGSDCAGASNVIKLAASNIHLHDFTVNGNNPNLTSGVVIGGEDIDARNGIIGNGSTVSNIEINNIEMMNIYLRGIYPQYTTGMNIHDNTVTNVRGQAGSIAIFSWVSSGIVTQNTVTNSNDGIVANHSKGITFSNNNVSDCDSGIHTDNNGSSGGVADLITGNTVSNGSGSGSYGIFVFVPYLDITVSENSINNVHVGFTTSGDLLNTGSTVTFERNSIDGQSLAGSTAFYFTTDTWGYGDGNNSTEVKNNFVTNVDYLMYLEANAGFQVNEVSNDNSFTNFTSGISHNGAGTFSHDLTCNWWGSVDGDDVMIYVGPASNYSPWLINGTDDQPGTPGFQPVAGSCLGSPVVIDSKVVTDEICSASGTIAITFSGGGAPYDIAWSGTASGSATGVASPYTIGGLSTGSYSFTITDTYGSTVSDNATINYLPVENTTTSTYYATIQAAVDAASSGDVIDVCAGTYNEAVVVNKALDIRGAQYGVAVDGRTFGDASESVVKPNTTGSAFKVTTSNTVSIRGFSLDGTNGVGGAVKGVEEWTPANGLTVKENFVRNFASIGISIAAGSYNFDIAQNDIQNNYVGVYLSSNAHDGSVTYNDISNHPGGSFDQGSAIAVEANNSNITLANNNIFNNANGLYVWTGVGTTLSNFNMQNNYIALSNTMGITHNLGGQTVNASCNYWGVSDNSSIYSRITGAGTVTYSPWITTGGNSANVGFNPTGTCSGTPVVIDAITTSGQTCGANDGSITVTFSGGGAPYDIAWSGTASGSATGIASPYTIGGLSVGTYSFTITDTYGSTVSDVATVSALLVTNMTTGVKYSTIQAAIDAASPGDAISICAGNFNEEVLVNKSLSLSGAKVGVDPRPSVGSSRTIGGLDETIVFAAKNKKVFTIDADNVTIDGIQITQTGSSGSADAVKASNSHNNIIFRNNIISAATDEGIQLEAGNDNEITNNYILNSKGDGITMSSYSVGPPLTGINLKIQDNDISGSESAYGSIYLYGVQNLEVSGNVITTKSSGIAIGSGGLPVSNVWVHHNDINTELRTAYSALAAGIAIDDSGDNITVENNSIIQFGGFVPSSLNDRYNLIRVGVANTSNPTNVSIHDNNLSRTADEYYIYVISSVTNTVDATCNWFSTNGVSEVTSRVVASGSITFMPFLNDGTDTDGGAVGFEPVAGSCTGCPDGLLVTNTNTGETFCSIQSAIDDADTQDGHTLEVGSGTYAENVVVNKELTINGPNASVDPCSGSRSPEAIVVPATSAINSGEIFHVAASNVTISGFTIDGDNTALTSGYLGTNGADIDAAEAITVYETGINNLTVSNNIMTNLSYSGVTLYDYPAGVASSGHLIEHNKISHLGTYDAASGIDKWGMGVLLYNNQYAHVTDNCIEDVRVGIQTGNFWRANPGSADCQKIENNTIQARRRGIFHNLFYSAASPFTVSNNTITGLDNSNETLWDGMLVSSHANAVQTIQDNSVDGTGISTQSTIGINIWNDQVAPLVDGGNISNVEIGINVNNYEGYNNSNANNTLATIESVTISATTEAGIKVHDNPSNTNGATVNATIGNGNTITGSPIGVWIVGSDATATITHNDFTSNTTDIQADATAGSVVANYNNLSGSSYGINNLSANTLDGKHNYWNDGDDSGPGSVGSGTGVHVSTNVDFCPWLDDAAPVGVAVNAAAGTLLVTETGGPVDDDGEVCSGEAVTLTVDGAQPGSTYLWTGGETIPTVNLNPTSSMVYSVTVSYGGCTTVHSYNITVYPVLGVNLVDLDNVLCYGESNGSIEVTGDIGQSPYSYNWSNGVTTALNAGLSAGVYDVTVTDANQCTASASYTVTEPTLLEVVNFAVSNESCQACDDGTITVNATGGITPYQYSNDGGATWHGSNFFGGLVAGTYSMIVKDVNGCETAPQDVVITEDGVYPDLRAFRVISSSQYYMGDTSDEMIQIRNVGTGQTVAPIEFLVTKFVPAAGVDISQNMDVSVTILGDTYPLSNSSFTVVDLGYAYKFTSNSGIYIPVGGFLNVGLKYERVGGTKGQMSSSVNITNGTGGGEINYQNNISIIKMIKL